MSSFAYPRGKAILISTGDWSKSTVAFGALLASSDYTPDPSHKYVRDVRGELKGGGYKRQDLVGRSVVQNDERADCMADTLVFEGLASTASYRWLVLFRKNATDAESDLVCAIDMTRVDLSGISTHKIRWDGKEKNGRAFSLT